MKKYVAMILSVCMLMGTTAFAISDTDITEYQKSKSTEYSEIVKDATTKDGESLAGELENATIMLYNRTLDDNRNQFSTYKSSEFYKELQDVEKYYAMTSDDKIIYLSYDSYSEKWIGKIEDYPASFKKFFDSSLIAELLNTENIKTVNDMRIVYDNIVGFFMMYLNTDKGEYAILCDGISGYKYLPNTELEAFKLYTADEIVEFVKEYLKAETEYQEKLNEKQVEKGYAYVDENNDAVYVTPKPAATVLPSPTAQPTTAPSETAKPKTTEIPQSTTKPIITSDPPAPTKAPLTVKGGDNITISVGNEKITFPDAQPFIDENDRTQIPIRAVAEMLDCTVDWNKDTETAIITREDGRTATLTIGSDVMIVNNTETNIPVQMDTAAIIKDERTYIPVRFVAEAMGLTVNWQN